MTEWILSSTVLIAAVLLLRLALRGKISLRLQYALWALVLLRLLIPVSFGGSALSVENWTKKAAQTEPVRVMAAVTEAELPSIRYQWTGDEAVQNFNGAAASAGESAAGLSVAELLKLVWLCGAALMGLWFVLCNLRMARALKRSRVLLLADRALPVYVSGAVDTPCLFGLLRPAVYLTREAADSETVTRHAVEHELTHFRHRDNLWAVLRCVCLALHWYNPLVWCAAVCSRNDAELACDEATIRRLGEGERAAYGRTLLCLTCEKRTALLNTATTMTGSGRSIRERIALIVKKPKMAAYTAVAVVLIAALAVGCTFTGANEPDAHTDGVTICDCGGLSAAIPGEYIDELIVYAGEETGEENVLLKVYGRAAAEAFAAAGVGEDDSMGLLFSLVRWDQARYEEYLGEDGSGADVFARDDTWYYVCVQPTDSTFYPTGDMADQERWEELLTELPATVKADFVTRNDVLAGMLTPENAVAEVLAAAYQEAQTYGLDIELSQGQVLPWGDTDYEVEFPVKNTYTYILVKINRAADGSWSVVKSEVIGYGLLEPEDEAAQWELTFPANDVGRSEYSEDIFAITPFDVQSRLPSGWYLDSNDPQSAGYLYSGLWSRVGVYNTDGVCVGAIGYNVYDPDEVEDGEPMSIYSQIALGNDYQFNVRETYRMVVETPQYETAAADVWYAPGFAGAADEGEGTTNYGILACALERPVYIAFEFDSDAVTQEQVNAIAQSIVLSVSGSEA